MYTHTYTYTRIKHVYIYIYIHTHIISFSLFSFVSSYYMLVIIIVSCVLFVTL